MMNKEIPIFFTIDDNYAKYAACAIKSIIENSSRNYNYNIIIVNEGLSDLNITKLKSLEEGPFKISFKEITEGLETITDREENKLRCDYFTLTIYMRLFLADMFPDLDKAIYIDSDIVVPGDISKLYNIDLGDNIFGVCRDLSIMEIPELINYIENAIGIKKEEYINSGVLLMNLKMMRECSFSDHFLTLLNKYHFDTVAPDQDYVNAMCNGKLLYLDSTWDTMPNDNNEPVRNPSLIHYNLFQKPWCYDNIQYNDYFWEYAKRSGYYDELLEYKKNYTLEKQEKDRESLDILVKKADKIPENEITFKKIEEKYHNIRIKKN